MPLGDDVDVRLRDRRIPVVGRQDALAAERVARASAARAARGRRRAWRGGAARSARRTSAASGCARSRARAARGSSRRRRARRAAARGSGGRRAARSSVIGRSRWGMTHGGVRWKRSRCSTIGWICGTAWIADAPVPITATRRPVRSWSWFQRAVWNVSPSKLSRPGSVGDGGLAEEARRRDQEVGGERALRGLDPPDALRPRPTAAPVTSQSKLDVVAHAEAVGARRAGTRWISGCSG